MQKGQDGWMKQSFGEQHEMMFNYIYIGAIQSENKKDLIQSLVRSSDLELFE